MDRFLFWRLKTEPAEKVCSDEACDYYSLLINGYRIMFAKNRWRPDGLRLYILNDEFARALGFASYQDMRARVKLQYSRRMLSPQAIERHFK